MWSMGILRNAVAGTLLGAVVAGAGCTSSGRAFTEFAARTATASYLEGQLNPHDRGGRQQQANRQVIPFKVPSGIYFDFADVTSWNGRTVISMSVTHGTGHVDMNNDGRLDLVKDIIGNFRNVFKKDEQVNVYALISEVAKYPELTLRVWDSNGNVLREQTEISPENYIVESFKPGELNSGEYRYACYTGNRLLASLSFHIQ